MANFNWIRAVDKKSVPASVHLTANRWSDPAFFDVGRDHQTRFNFDGQIIRKMMRREVLERLTLDDLDGQPFVWDVWEARRPDWFGYVDVDESDGTDPRLVPLSTTPPPRLAVTPVFRPRRMVPFFHRVMPIGSDTTLILLEKNT